MTTSLFEDLTRDPRFPEQLIKAAAEHDSVKYIEIGDEGDWLVMLGHPATAQAIAVIRREGYYDFVSLPDETLAADLDRTWARLLVACPDHGEEQDGCEFCGAQVSAEQWWLDWAGGEDKQDVPGWFPVTVWKVNA